MVSVTVQAQIDSLLSGLAIPRSDTFPERFTLDAAELPYSSEWATIPLTREIETEYFNPFITRAGYDYSFYEEGELAPMVLLQLFDYKGGKYLLYGQGCFNGSYYLADVTSGKKYPPILLLHSAEASAASVGYNYDRATDEIVISSIDRSWLLRVDMTYRLDRGFPLVGHKYFRRIMKEGEDTYVPYVLGNDDVVWEEITENEWRESLMFSHPASAERAEIESVPVTNCLPDSIPPAQLMKFIEGPELPIEIVKRDLIPFLNMAEDIARHDWAEANSYYANQVIKNCHGKFLLYTLQSGYEINLMLADLSEEGSYPRTLILQRMSKVNQSTRIFYTYDPENNIIEINTITQFADYPPYRLKKSYRCTNGFPYVGTVIYHYNQYLDCGEPVAPYENDNWIELSPTTDSNVYLHFHWEF